jgi:hypothetical protein
MHPVDDDEACQPVHADEEDLADEDEVSRRLRPMRYACCCCWQSKNLLILSMKKVDGSRPDDKI